ncbi:hypothetical protein [uncultured Pseudokineococcus sp.]|uniref:hypothetical protein n=1 Tax=uncultured Pseudokineococcus sp. TaxID=1642928 RepID=UPI00261828D9|nr:hypothetical protein [uncultured Pseudokineococcus sp.]
MARTGPQPSTTRTSADQAGARPAGPCPPAAARVPRPRSPEELDALLAHARADRLVRPRAARVLSDVIDRLLDERLAATGGASLVG